MIELIYGCAGFSQHRTAAGDKAPCIEISAVLHRDRAVIRHFNIAIIAHRASLLAASGKIPAAQADGAIDGNRSALAHRQRPERFRCRGRADCRRSICIQSPSCIKWNQQCNTRRDGISAADRTIGSQGNLGLFICLRISNCFVQICKPLTAGLKKRNGFACKFCRNGAVAFNIQRCACGSCYALAGGQVVPAKELITLCRGCHHLISRHGALCVAVCLCDSLAIYCIGTIFGRHKGSSRRYVRDQRYIGHGNFCSCRAARLDINLDGTTRGKLPAEAAVCGNGFSTDLNGAAVLLDGISKGQCSLCSLVVFDGQCGFMGCVAAGSTNRYD